MNTLLMGVRRSVYNIELKLRSLLSNHLLHHIYQDRSLDR